MAINLTNKLNAATTDKVLVDAIQVAGGYMAITSDQRANLTSAQKVAGTLVYETDTGKTYRYIKTAPDKYEWKEEIVQKQGDWNQPDETAPDYIKNRTHYIQEEEETLYEGNFAYEDGYFYDAEYGVPSTGKLVSELEGKLIRIYSDAFKVPYLEGLCKGYYVGNLSLSSSTGSDTGENLYIEFYIEDAEYTHAGINKIITNELSDNVSTGMQFNFRIVCVDVTIKQLDEKFIPDAIARKSEIPDISNISFEKDWNQSDENAPDYIKNRTHYETLATKLVHPISEDRDDRLACWPEGEAVGTKQKVGLLHDMYGHPSYGDELITEENCGKTYRITSSKLLGNVTFEGVLKQGAKTTTEDYYYIGNPAYAGSFKSNLPTEDSSENFCLVTIRYHEGAEMPYPGSLWMWVEADTTVMDSTIFTDGFVSVRIEHVYPEVKTLDEKYIPDTIARAKHNHEFKDIIDSAYDDSSKWKEITDLLNQHVYGDLITVYTGNDCKSSGMGYRICECCGRKKLELIKVDHEWSMPTISINDTTHSKVCGFCGKTETEPHDIDYYASEDGVGAYTVYSVCSTCGEIDSHSHFACGDIGCTKCNLIIPNPDPNGCTHKWEYIGSGGSDETGWNNFYECSKCGEYIEVTVD